MFTGIVTEVGSVVEVTRTDGGRRIVVAAPATASDLIVGASVAVNGVCLTATHVAGERFAVDVVGETVARSNLGGVAPGDAVNLERPMAAGGRFDGHVVQGHVDAVGVVAAIRPEGEARRIRISIPPDLARYVVEKGSVTVDGVSLTITAVAAAGETEPWFEVVLIPHTLDVTLFGSRGVGDGVNLEADVIAKYVEHMLAVDR